MTNNPWTWTHLCTCEVNISKNKQTKNQKKTTKTNKQSKPFWQLQENERIFFNDWFNQQENVFFVLNSWFSGATKSLFNSQRSEESLTDRYFSIFLLRSFFFLFRLWLCRGTGPQVWSFIYIQSIYTNNSALSIPTRAWCLSGSSKISFKPTEPILHLTQRIQRHCSGACLLLHVGKYEHWAWD